VCLLKHQLNHANPAIIITVIIIDPVAIVAILANLHRAVAASGTEAGVGTAVEIVFVAVITGFETGRSLGDITARYTIAAARQFASRGAFVSILVVRIIATLKPCLDEAITAARYRAKRGTFVVAEQVAIVAGFKLWIAKFQVPPQNTIAAERLLATVSATIVID
jgi:hypothetical protein